MIHSFKMLSLIIKELEVNEISIFGSFWCLFKIKEICHCSFDFNCLQGHLPVNVTLWILTYDSSEILACMKVLRSIY